MQMASNVLKYEFRVNGYFNDPYWRVCVVLKYDGRNDHGRRYRVTMNGQMFGSVERDYATFERAPKGCRYVMRRWRSLRWYGVPPYPRKRTFDRETIKRAAEELAKEWCRAKVDAEEKQA